jgi:hypothetical protein
MKWGGSRVLKISYVANCLLLNITSSVHATGFKEGVEEIRKSVKRIFRHGSRILN